MFLLISILSLLSITCTHFLTAIRTTDLCLNVSECNEDFPFKCNKNFCGKNNFTCEYLRNFEKTAKMTQTSLFQMNFAYILNSVLSCVHKFEYKWKPSDVCLKQKNCFKLKYDLFFAKIYKSIDSDNCKCEEKHNIQCQDRNFCGLKKTACKNLIKNDARIKKCGKKYLFE